MGTTGKSKRPPPRDSRADEAAATNRTDEVRKLSSRSMRAVRDGRAEPEVPPGPSASPDPDVARLHAERAADADDMAAMLVRLADAERARGTAEGRAAALETWTVELEAKVAEARTRADDLEVAALEVNSELARLRERVRELEGEVTGRSRDHEDALAVALEVERVKRGLEREPSGTQHGDVAVAVVHDAEASSGLAAARQAMQVAVRVLAQLEEQELSANAARLLTIEQLRRLLAGDLTTTPPPALDSVREPISLSPVTLPRPLVPDSAAAVTVPKPSAPASPPAVTVPKASAPATPAAVTVSNASAPVTPPAVTVPKRNTPATPAIAVPRPVAPPFPPAATAPRPGPPAAPPAKVTKKDSPPPPAPPTLADATTELLSFEDLDLGD